MQANTKQFVVVTLGSVVLHWISSGAAAQFPAFVDPSDFDGTNGLIVYGNLLGEFGQKVAGIGDVNADGIDDMISGGAGVWEKFGCGCETTAGASFVIFGSPDIGGDGSWTTEKLDGTNGFRIPGIHPGDAAGFVSAAGDFDDDGILDFLSEPRTPTPTRSRGPGKRMSSTERRGCAPRVHST